MNVDEKFIEDDEIDLIGILFYILSYRKWIIISVLFSLIIGALYNNFDPEVYKINSTIFFKDENSDPSTFINDKDYSFLYSEGFKNQDRISLLTSSLILEKVVHDLELEYRYYIYNPFSHNSEISRNELPFTINFKEDINPEKFKISIIPSKIIFNFNDQEISFPRTQEEFENSLFKYKSKNDLKSIENQDYLIEYLGEEEIIRQLKSNYTVSLLDNKSASTYELSYSGENQELNNTILTKIIEEIEKNNVEDKRKLFLLSIDFIENRLRNIERSIDSINSISTEFRKSNKIYKPDAQTFNVLTNLEEIDQTLFKNTLQIEISNSIIKELNKPKITSLLPTNIGLESDNINDLINQFNRIIIDQNNLLSDSTEKNPLNIQFQEQLGKLRVNILKSLELYISKLETTSKRFQDDRKRNSLLVDDIPLKESQLNNLNRDYDLYSNLYSFLSQKKEEALINLSSLQSNIVVLNKVGYKEEIASKPPYLILSIFSFIGLVLSIGVILLIKLIRDILFVDIEYLITTLKEVEFLGVLKFKIDRNEEMQDQFIESLRLLAYNIRKITISKKKGTSIMITSSEQNEGKTYSSYHISEYLSELGYKVFLLDGDLRKPELNNYFNSNISPGFTEIIENKSQDFDKLLKEYTIRKKNLDFLNAGLKLNSSANYFQKERFKQFISFLKESYDYVIIDTAPLIPIVDSLYLFDQVDHVIHVFRNNYSKKKYSGVLLNYKQKYQLENISYLIVDDTTQDKFISKYGYGSGGVTYGTYGVGGYGYGG